MIDDSNTTHLLATLGVLSSFSIAKKISKIDILRETKKIKRLYKGKDTKKINEVLLNSILKATKKRFLSDTPPGLIIPEITPTKEKLNKMYLELTNISSALSTTFLEKKLTKHQLCFIINTVVNLLKMTEEDFDDFQKEFMKYKNGEI